GLVCGQSITGVGKLPGNPLRNQPGEALQRAEVGHDTDVYFLYAKETVGSGISQVAGGGKIDSCPNTPTLHGSYNWESGPFESAERLLQSQHHIAQILAVKSAVGLQQVTLLEHAQIHAGREVLACGRNDQDSRSAFSVQSIDRIAQFNV